MKMFFDQNAKAVQATHGLSLFKQNFLQKYLRAKIHFIGNDYLDISQRFMCVFFMKKNIYLSILLGEGDEPFNQSNFSYSFLNKFNNKALEY